MASKRYCQNLCPDFQRGIALIGKPWNGLILAALAAGEMRFGELLTRLGAIGDRMLSERLKELQAHGLVSRSQPCAERAHVSYALTSAGKSFDHVYLALTKWGGSLPPARAAAPADPICLEPAAPPKPANRPRKPAR